MLKLMETMSVNAVEDIKDLKGKRGRVELAIAEGKEGQVTFSSKKTGRLTVPATSDRNIKVDEIVIVTDVIGDVIRVKPAKISKDVDEKKKDQKKEEKKKTSGKKKGGKKSSKGKKKK